MLTLLLDETGRGIGRGEATNVPDYVLGRNEVEATPEQFAEPTAWMLKGKKLVAAPALPATAAPVPSISRAQAKIQLMREALLDQVKVLVGEAGPEAQLWFDEAGIWTRGNPYVAQIGEALKLSAERIDDLFRAAALIDA